jgi:hypothetical protein
MLCRMGCILSPLVCFVTSQHHSLLPGCAPCQPPPDWSHSLWCCTRWCARSIILPRWCNISSSMTFGLAEEARTAQMGTRSLQPQVASTVVKIRPCFGAASPCQPRLFTHSHTSNSGCNNHRQSGAATTILTHSLPPAEVMHILLLLHIVWLCSCPQDARQTCALAEIPSTTRQLRQGEAVQQSTKSCNHIG